MSFLAANVSRWRAALGAAALALAVACVYQPAMRGGWIWDDFTGVALNPEIRSGDGLHRIWLHPSGPDFFPLKSSALWLEWRAWGDHPAGFHAVSLAGHLAAALLLWRLLERLGLRWAWVGALVFAIHPLAVESAAWISEQKNTLSLPLLLLAADAYLDFDAERRRAPYLRSVAFFAAAMLCKSSVVMFPAILLLYAWWRRGRVSRADLAATAPFFAISLVLGLTTVWFQTHRAMDPTPIVSGSFRSRVAWAALALCFYAGKCVLPVGLMPIYPRPPELASATALWPCLLALAIAAWAFCLPGGPVHRGARLALGFFALNLVPVLGLIPMAFQRIGLVSDHLAYVPLLGWSALAAGGAAAAWGRLPPVGRTAAGLAAVAALAALVLESRAYAAVFRGDESFWACAVARDPDSAEAHYNLANARLRSGRPAEAVPDYETALRLRPEFLRAQASYGDALRILGRAALDAGRFDDAIVAYRRAAGLDPAGARPRGDLAYALARAGRLSEAADAYRATLGLDPASTEDWDQLGTVLMRLGRSDDARASYERALRLDPGNAAAHNNLGLLLARGGRLREAIGEFEAALRARPDFDAARRNLILARAALP